MRGWAWMIWTAALAAVVLGLAWQVADAEGRIQCAHDAYDRMILCAGGLHPWVLPTSVGIGLGLIGIGTWALMARRR